VALVVVTAVTGPVLVRQTAELASLRVGMVALPTLTLIAPGALLASRVLAFGHARD
jgi:hypothetical protein